MVVPAERCSSSPGISGVVMTVSRDVGAGITMARATSSRGIQIVNGSAVVRPGAMSRPYSKALDSVHCLAPFSGWTEGVTVLSPRDALRHAKAVADKPFAFFTEHPIQAPNGTSLHELL